MRTTTLWPMVTLLVFSATGCAVFDGGGVGAAAVAPARLDAAEGRARARSVDPSEAAAREIVDDFLHALGQLDGHAPGETAVRFARDALAADPFLAVLERAMRERGYAVRPTSTDGEPGNVAYRAERDGGGLETEHTLVVGELQMRRRYRMSPGAAPLAVGPLFVLGADASGIDTDRFHPTPLRVASGVPPVNRPPARYTFGDVD